MGSFDKIETAGQGEAPGFVTDSGQLGLDFFRSCFEEFPDPVLVADCERRILFLNRAAEKVLGCTLEESGPLLCEDILHAEAADGRGCFVEHCLEGRLIRSTPGYMRNADGKWLSASVSAQQLKGDGGKPLGCLAILRDVHTDLRAQPDAQMQVALLQSILENFPTPFFTVDSNLVITYMNHHLEKLTGYTRREVVNRMTCDRVLCTAQCGTRACLLEQAMESKIPMSGVRRAIVDREGRRVPVVVNASMITDENGRVIGGFEAIRDITPIVEAEQKIELLTEMTQEGILMVNEGRRIIFANSRIAEIVGRSREQLLGMDVGEVLPAQHQKMMIDLMQRVDREEQQQLSFCSTIQPLTASEGDYRAFETCMAVSRVGKSVISCMYFHDLTKRIEIERQLRNANSFLTNIIRSSVDGIVVVSTEGEVLIFNEGAERILGYKAEEVIGHSEVFRQFYDPVVARANMRLMRSDSHGPPGKLNTTRVTFLSKDGKKVPVNFSAAIIKESGKEIGSVGIFSDLREHLRIRRELEEAKIQLLQAEKIASLGRLAAGVAHEINNPLAGILIYADMLMKEVGENRQWKEDLEEIIHQTLRCKEIVTRLLEFSRQPLGQKVLFDSNDIIDRSIELLGHQPLFHDIKFCQDLQHDLPQVLGDPGQIQQVVINLIINAANAMGGKGRISIASSFDESSREVMLTFLDTGPGIPAEILEKIFEPFFTTKRPGEGTGLGLSVAYGIVQQHGGKIWAENWPAGGAVFKVVLPLEPPEMLNEVIEEY